MEDHDVNTLIWEFMIVSQQSAVNLGKDYLEKSATKNSKTIVRCDKKVGKGSENQGISMIDWQESSWKRTTLLITMQFGFKSESLRILRFSIVQEKNQ